MASSSSACLSRTFTGTFPSANPSDARRNRGSRSPRQKSRYTRLVLALLALITFACPGSAQTAHFGGNIVTLGSGFANPYGVAIDARGNLFIADYSNNAVKEIFAAGGYTAIVTLGSGFSTPSGVAVDANGNVFVADNGSNTVKEIIAVGGAIPFSSPTINTLGSGFSYPTSVALDSNGNVFVADSGHNAVKEILAAGGYTTVNTLGSGFSNPGGVAVDSRGNVFVADQGNGAVKEILAAGGYVTVNTLASGFSGLFGVTVDVRGNIFVGDNNNNAVKEIVSAGGYTTALTLGSGFSTPTGVAVDASGNVFVADLGSNAIKEIVSASVNYGSAPVATSTPLTIPLTFTFDTSGTILAPSVLTQGATGLDFTDAGTGTCAAGSYNAAATCTVNVTFTPKAPGIRYGAATLKNSSGTVIATAYVYGVGVGPQIAFGPTPQITLGSGFSSPFGVAVDASGNIFVADFGNSQIKEVLAAGGYTTVNTIGSGFSNPTSVAVDGSGNVFVADYGNSRVKEVLAAGGYTTVNTLGSGFNQPVGVAVDASGNVFVAGYRSNHVNEILAAGGYTTVLTLGGTFNSPTGVAVDENGNVFVGGFQSNAVNEILAAGGYTTVNTLGSGFNDPFAVALDINGNVLVVESGGGAVKKILAAGAYTTVNILANGFSGPNGVAVGSDGNVYVGDTSSNSVKKLDYASPPSLAFASTQVGATSSDSPKTVTLTISGNAALTFPTPASGLNPSITTGFTLGNSSTCPQLSTSSSPATLAVGASCTNLISFSPTAAGSISGSLTLTDDTLNAQAPTYTTQSLALSGTGTLPSPTIAFNIPAHTYGDAPFTVNATSNSTGAFTYTVVSGPATISGATVTLTGVGTVVVQASEAADSNYAAATSNTTFTVAAATPAISFSVPTHTYGDAPFTVSATSNSTGAFTYSVVSGPATIAGSTITLTGAGTVVLQASEAANGNYTNGTQSVTFTVAASAPTITFAIPGHTYGDAPFTVGATSNSSGAFSYTVLSGPAAVAGSTVTLTGAGTVVIQASEAADSNYTASTQSVSFAVAAGTSTLAFSVPSHTYGDAPFAVSANSNSTGAFIYTVLSGPATISGSTVTLTGTGTVVLQAAQAASANYVAGSTSATFAVAAGTPILAFTVPNHGYGDAPFTVSAASNSSGVLTYTILSGPATIAGSTVTLTGTGTVALQASQTATANYLAATSTTTFVVAAGTPTLTFSVPNHIYNDAPFTVSATSNSPGAFTYTVVSGPVTIAGSTVTLTGAGTVVLQVSQAASANYLAASSTATFIVTGNTPTITFAVPNHSSGDAPFTVSATSNSPAAFTYAVVSGPANLSGATITLTSAGLVTLRASQAASTNYAAATITTTFLVTASITLSPDSAAVSTQTIPPGTAAAFKLAFTPGGGTYVNPLLLSVSGLPAGATPTFFPATIPAGAPATPIVLIVQTSSQTAHNDSPSSTLAPFALALLLMPLAGLKSIRKRIRHLPTLLALLTISVAATLGLSGCGSANNTGLGKSYPLVVTATDTVTGIQIATTVTLVVK